MSPTNKFCKTNKLSAVSPEFPQKRRTKTYHDLDHLAGTWSEKDLKEFHKNVEYLEKVDKEIWK